MYLLVLAVLLYATIHEQCRAPHQHHMRKTRDFFVNYDQLHFALREWRTHMSTPAVLAALLGVAFVLTIMVPFETEQMFGPIGRFGYWGVITSTTYGAGAFINEVVATGYRDRWSKLKRVIVSCLIIGAAITALVTAINYIIAGFVPDLASLPVYLGNIFAIAFVIAAMFHLAAKPENLASAQPVKILERVPLEKRGRLLALSVEDHYVSVITSSGTEMVLMRLRDAISEIGDTQGLQVHRSHWVALAAVKSALRDGDRAVITLVNGDEVPVSRRYIRDIKKAGII